MPLSDHEQRLLDEIEQALYAEDPKFAASVRSARARSRKHRYTVLSVVGVVAGLALVLVGLVTTIILLSVVGFVLVVGSCGYAIQVLRGRGRNDTPNASDAGTAPTVHPRSGGLRNRMEERLRRRFDEN